MLKQPNEPMTNLKNSGASKKRYLGPVATIFTSTNTGAWRIVRPVVDQSQCVLCGICQKYCPTDVIEIRKDGEPRGVIFDFNYCKGCGICANICPKKCISMSAERSE